MTYCFVVQKHFLKSQKIGKREQHVEYVTGHFIFMVPAMHRRAGSRVNGQTQSPRDSLKGFGALLPGTQPPSSLSLDVHTLKTKGGLFRRREEAVGAERRDAGRAPLTAESS